MEELRQQAKQADLNGGGSERLVYGYEIKDEPVPIQDIRRKRRGLRFKARSSAWK